MVHFTPLRTERKLVAPLWGGSRLPAWLNLPPPRPERLGETWQVFETNRVTDGPFAGHTLAALVATHGAALVGTRTAARYGADFPLLAKFIDAGDRLSLQVHPDDYFAHNYEAHTGFHGKMEAWYILDAAPNATVTYGLNRPCTQAEFAAAVAAGSVETLMNQLPVAPADVIFVPAGTIHAINAGILLFEIQQKSDLTYRVYDYGRVDGKTGLPRELHLAKALAISNFDPTQQGKVQPLALTPNRDLLIACPYFALERWTCRAALTSTTDPASFEILTVIGGTGTLQWPTGTMTLAHGESVVLPATLGEWAIAPLDHELTLLRAYVPDLASLTSTAYQVTPDEQRVAEVVRW